MYNWRLEGKQDDTWIIIEEFARKTYAQTRQKEIQGIQTRLNNQCKADKCTKESHSRGWCKLHYARWLIHGAVEDDVLFKRGRKTKLKQKRNQDNLYELLRHKICVDCGEN